MLDTEFDIFRPGAVCPDITSSVWTQRDPLAPWVWGWQYWIIVTCICYSMDWWHETPTKVIRRALGKVFKTGTQQPRLHEQVVQSTKSSSPGCKCNSWCWGSHPHFGAFTWKLVGVKTECTSVIRADVECSFVASPTCSEPWIGIWDVGPTRAAVPKLIPDPHQTLEQRHPAWAVSLFLPFS